MEGMRPHAADSCSTLEGNAYCGRMMEVVRGCSQRGAEGQLPTSPLDGTTRTSGFACPCGGQITRRFQWEPATAMLIGKACSKDELREPRRDPERFIRDLLNPRLKRLGAAVVVDTSARPVALSWRS
jgi:hypothetical protein